MEHFGVPEFVAWIGVNLRPAAVFTRKSATRMRYSSPSQSVQSNKSIEQQQLPSQKAMDFLADPLRVCVDHFLIRFGHGLKCLKAFKNILPPLRSAFLP